MHDNPEQLALDRTPLTAARFTVLDLETTGGAPPEHKITEIAAFHIENLEITDEFTTLVDPERSIPAFITNLTGISRELINGHPPSREVLPQLLKFLGDTVVVAHHSQFDRSFIDNELRLMQYEPINNGDLCTSRLARRILPWLPSKSLGALAQFFGIKIENRHRAAGDAYATCRLLIVLLEYLRHRGIHTLEEVLLFQFGEYDYPQ